MECQSTLSLIYIGLLVLTLNHLRFINADEVGDELEDIPVVEGFGNVIIPEEEDVLILNKDNFDHVISTRKLILVEFYAPWCGHCKTLAPEYEAAAKELLADDIRIAKIDATVEDELAKRFEIAGFPTIKLFKREEEPVDYDGPRTSSGIVDFMKIHADPNYKPPPSAVIELTDDTFEDFMESNELALVEFYAPWCGHCKKLAPEYEAAARDLLDKIPLVKVDATKEEKLAKKYEIRGYPKLIIFRKGRQFEYKGPREHKGIVSQMLSEAELPSKDIKSTRDWKNAKRSDPYVFAYFTSENNFFEEYINSGYELKADFVLLHTFDSELAAEHKLPANSINTLFPKIYHSKYEESHYVYKKDDATQDEITEWIKGHLIPLVGHRTRQNMLSTYEKRPLVIVYYDVDFSHQYVQATQIIRHKVLSVAHKHKDITFAISNEEDFEDELKSFGLDDSGESVNVAIFGEGNKKYRMEPEEDFDSEVLEEFIENFVKGKLKAYLKSQPIPKRVSGPVKVLVGNNFNDEVYESGKDVLVEFYAPWCGHCKSLEPIYNKLAKYYKGSKDVVIAKMDATANDVPDELDVRGFPTIYLIKANDRMNPIRFDRERNFEGFREFLDEHASITPRDEL